MDTVLDALWNDYRDDCRRYDADSSFESFMSDREWWRENATPEQIKKYNPVDKEIDAMNRARLDELDRLIDFESKQFNRWTQKDIANFFDAVGKRYRELKEELL